MYIGDQLSHFVSSAGLTWPELAARVSQELDNGNVAPDYLEALGTGLLDVPATIVDALCRVLHLKRQDLQRVGDPTLPDRRAAFQSYVRFNGLDLGEAANLALSSVRIEGRALTLTSAHDWQTLHAQRAQRTLDDLFPEPAQDRAPAAPPPTQAYMLPCPHCRSTVDWRTDRCPKCGWFLDQPDD